VATPEEEAVMMNELMRVLRVSEEWMDSKQVNVESGSSFAGDDAKTHPFDLSQGVAQSIAAAVDHLHCLRMALTGTGDNALRLHTYAPFTLLRATVENAAIAVWVMSASRRNERILRHIRHQLTSFKKLKKTLALAGDTDATITNERENSLLDIADACGIDRAQATKEVTATEMMRSASGATGFNTDEMDLMLTFWKISSAVAHGDRGYLPIFDQEVGAQVRPGVSSVRITAPTNWILSGSRGAVAMITAARRLAAQRGTSHL
jgi:hypothetical protein